jgi:CO/xanthine dehydrogenase Mo-binding subunit
MPAWQERRAAACRTIDVVPELPADGRPFRVIGISRPRTDSRAKVTGAARYAADQPGPAPGLLHARLVPSVYAHARIRGINASGALAMPGVVAVLTAADLPIQARGDGRRFEPLARDVARFAGQPVALVVARSEAEAEDALDGVQVDLEPMPAVLDAVTVAATAADDDDAILGRFHTAVGDARAALADADAVVEGRFVAPWVHQGYLEPHAATAWVDDDGTLVVSSSTQGLFDARNVLAELFALPVSRVRVTAPPIGGAFGSKEVLVEPLVAAAALRLGRPVRIALTRREDMAATNPAQGIVTALRIGADGSGRFEGLEARMVYDGGAFPDASWEWFAAGLITGPYRWPAFTVDATGVRTNRFGSGHYRAPSGPQGLFALESLIDELATRLGIDPVELRRRNLVDEGDPRTGAGRWPRFGLRKCLDELGRHPLWQRRDALPPNEGVGIAGGVWRNSAQPAAATCRLEPDGTLTVATGVVDLAGSLTILGAVAAEAFGVPFASVRVVVPSTDSAPPTPGTNATAITYGVGPAVRAAAEAARDQLLAIAADDLEIDPRDLEIVDGVIRPRDGSSEGVTVAALARELDNAWGSPRPPVEGHGATAHTQLAPTATAHLAHVRVDPETGAVELLGYVAVQDVGRALNPALVEGQMAGGAVQGIGRALHEALVHDEAGQLVTGTLLDYALPRATMVPPIETHWLEIPAPEGPFGARGMAEAPVLPAPAAIANAIAAATGTRVRELPMTAQRVWRAIQGPS